MASFSLAQTQRGRVLDIIRSDQRDAQDRTISTVDDIVLENMNESGLVNCDKNGDGEKNKRNCCCLKGILVCVAILAFLAVMLGLVIHNRSNSSPDQRGSITDDVPVKKECEDVHVALGSDITIICRINTDTWREDKLPGKVIAFHENSALNLTMICDVTNREVTCAATLSNCSSAGNFHVTFYSSHGKDASVLFTRTVFVNITAPPTDHNVETFITQDCMNDGTTSVFHLRCSYANDCNNYEILFTANDTVTVLSESQNCSLVYSDSTGHSVNCSTLLSEDIILKYGNHSDVFCKLRNSGMIRRERQFELPDCTAFYKSNENFSSTTTKVSHSSNGDGSYILKWCRDNNTSFIYKSEEKLLCPIMNQTGSSSESSPTSSSTTFSSTETSPNTTARTVTISSPSSTRETTTVL